VKTFLVPAVNPAARVSADGSLYQRVSAGAPVLPFAPVCG
jgi:hypothetical protein